MCRSSARGCTVIPGDPASTQTSTASITLGMRPPRELRSVATLLTFTERRIMKWAFGYPDSAEVFFHHVHDFLRPAADVVLILPFEHDAQQRLGARVAHEQPSAAGDARF